MQWKLRVLSNKITFTFLRLQRIFIIIALYCLWSVTSGLRKPISTYSAPWARRLFYCECCT